MPKKDAYNFEPKKTSKKGSGKSVSAVPTKKGPVVKPGMRIPVKPEQRKTTAIINEKLVEVANKSPNLTIREAAKTVQGDIVLALSKQEKYEKACRRVLRGIQEFRKITKLEGEFDRTKKLSIRFDPSVLNARLGEIDEAISELREVDAHKFSHAVLNETMQTFRSSMNDILKLIEAANVTSEDLTNAVASKAASEMRGAKILENFQTLSNFVYGNRVRTVGQTEEDYDKITAECKAILNQFIQ